MTDPLSLYGTDEPQPDVRRFKVGTLSFELVGDELRAIAVAGMEVVRAIQFLMRDRDWGTPTPTIEDIDVSDGEAVRITCRGTCTLPEGNRVRYALFIRARADAIDVEAEAEALGDVLTSRLGFCVLHPSSLAGVPLTVEHGDASLTESRFPELIDPRQPFTDVAALTHRQAGVTVTCRLEGDAFEMEDQRNWSDASYKTYVRPLARPWPYVVPDGTRIRQAVRLRIDGAVDTPCGDRATLAVSIGEPDGVMPRIGLVISPEEAAATIAHAEDLAAIGVQDLLLSIDLSAGEGGSQLAALARAASASSARRTLECVLAADGDLDVELKCLASAVAGAGLAIDTLVVFPHADLGSTPPGSAWPPCPPLAEVYAAAARAFPGVPIGGGMFGYFTELNRKRVPADGLAFVTHATCPIVHAADDRSVMQSLDAVPAILRSARAIYPDTPYRLGPITIGMRQNPYGARTMPNPLHAHVPMAALDPRQDGRFAAAWTIGYAARTEGADLETLTLGTLTGPRGLLGRSGRRPIFEAVRLLAGLAGLPRRRCHASDDGVAAVCAGGRLILANLTDRPVTVRLGDGRVQLEPFGIVERPAAPADPV